MSGSSAPLRLFVPDGLTAGVDIALSADQARYLVQVMRRKAADPVLLFNGCDGEWQGRLTPAGKKATAVHLEQQTRKQSPEPDLWLLFAPVKRTAIDLMAQKATELGVSVLWLVLTSHTNSNRVNVDRLTAIAIEAAEQSHRLSVPEVRSPVPLADAFAHWPADRVLYVLDETGSGIPIADALSPSNAREPGSGAFVIGPEGGFTNAELDLLRGLPFSRLVSLGPRILRAETAALAALTCWQALCGDWRSTSDAECSGYLTEAGTV